MKDYPEAKCLDGSPSAIYWREGSGESIDKYIFYFQGGDWCSGLTLEETMEDCIRISKTDLGSSNNYKETANFGGIFSQDIQINPYFYNYNHIFLNYCDGSGHQGYRENSIEYDSQEVWFRGQMNTEAAFNYALEKLNMKNASKVIVSGSSAGGLASLSWINYIADYFYNLGTHARVLGVSDSGVYLNFTNMNSHVREYEIRLKNLMYFSNSKVPPVNEECVKAYYKNQWQCMLGQNLLNYVNSTTIIIQSEYDSWTINNIIGANCIQGNVLTNCTDDQLQNIEDYRSMLLSTMKMLIYQKPYLSFWSPACVTHNFLLEQSYNSEDWRVPQQSLYSVQKSIFLFTQLYSINNYDKEPWPSNQECSNVKPISLEQ